MQDDVSNHSKMNDEQTRACPFCAETIKAAAKVCPRCRQALSLRCPRHPITGFFVAILPALAFMFVILGAVVTKFERILHPQPYYTEYFGSLRITKSEMNWVPTTNGLRIYLVGLVTNQSHIAWKDLEFECRFFDSNGLLVDAGTGSSRFTVEPNNESAFRVILTPALSTNEYATFRVSVGTARNIRAFF